MQFNYFMIFSLVSTLGAKVQEVMADKEVTVGEIYQLLGDIIDQLGVRDTVIISLKKKEK